MDQNEPVRLLEPDFLYGRDDKYIAKVIVHVGLFYITLSIKRKLGRFLESSHRKYAHHQKAAFLLIRISSRIDYYIKRQEPPSDYPYEF